MRDARCSLGRTEGEGTTRRARRRSGAMMTAALASTIVVACAGKPAPSVAPNASVSGKCPDLTKADELAAFEFSREFAISREAADKVKAAALASMEINTLADKLDADLGIACAQIARDLGNKGDWRSGTDACAAAIKAVQDAHGRLGARAQSHLVLRQPTCLAPPSLVTKCASLCDSSVPAEKARAECEKQAGRCDGSCDGSCESKGALKCDGVCNGTCEGPIKGTCGGRCNGTCDGKRVSGGCLGICVGNCEKGAVSGECKGACNGACVPQKPGICDGVCTGTCTVELTEAKCSGGFKVPQVSADCRALCDLAVMNKTECSTPQVGFVTTGAKDTQTSEAMKGAIDKSFPALMKILAEIGEQAPKRVVGARGVIESARAGWSSLARSGGAATAADAEAQLKRCFDEPFKKAAATSAIARTAVDQALAVRDAASGATAQP